MWNLYRFDFWLAPGWKAREFKIKYAFLFDDYDYYLL